MDEVQPHEWIRPGDMNIIKKHEPKIDKPVSDVVGFPVYVNDRRLISLVNKWRTSTDPGKFDDFMKNPEFIKELKQAFQK